MCGECQSIINSLKSANADKDLVIKHLAGQLGEANQLIVAQSALIDKITKWMEEGAA